jgi:hypothetical protein
MYCIICIILHINQCFVGMQDRVGYVLCTLILPRALDCNILNNLRNINETLKRRMYEERWQYIYIHYYR